MRVFTITIAIVLSYAFPLALPSDASAAEPPKTPTALVALLGDPSFKVREAASRELLRLGEKSLDAVRAGAENPDPEIAQRCVRLLPTIRDAVAESLLKRFAENPATLRVGCAFRFWHWRRSPPGVVTPQALRGRREITSRNRLPE